MSKRIVIAGGSGFIGQALCNYFGIDNQIIILGRQLPTSDSNSFGQTNLDPSVLKNIQYVKWDGRNSSDWEACIDGADLVINLTGKSVNCRYTEKNKQAIFDSRVDATKAIGHAIQKAVKPPELWINASSATIYPFATDTPRDESFTDFKDDFSVQVCKLWEKTFYEQRTPFTRKIALRAAITLGQGGVMIPCMNLLKFGLGGRQGSGKQMYSWVHETDLCRMIDWLSAHKPLEGTYNCSSPNAVTNADFMATLRRVAGTSFGLPAYEWMLKIGAKLIGTEAELLLKSRWVIPTRILQTGFKFQYPLLEDAFRSIILKMNRH